MSNSPVSATDRKNVQNANTPDALQKSIKDAANDLKAGNSKASVGDLQSDLDQLLSKDKDKKDAVDALLGKSDPKAPLSSVG